MANGYLKKQYKFKSTRDFDHGSVRRKKVKFLQTGEVFDSLTQAAKATGVSIFVISKMVNEKMDNPKFSYA